MRKSAECRFWEKVSKGPECWGWAGYLNPHGYGKFYRDGSQRYAHRVSWELTNGEIPKGLVIDHLCRNTSCVNPRHMEPVTPSENKNRGIGQPAINSRKTHCKYGHEFTEENIYIRKRRQGGKACKMCAYEASRMQRLNNKTRRRVI